MLTREHIDRRAARKVVGHHLRRDLGRIRADTLSRDAVIACANKAREAGCDLLLSVGGGSTTDGGKAVTICLEHDIREPDGLEPFRTVVDEVTGKRSFPQYRAPTVRQICDTTGWQAHTVRGTFAGAFKKKLGLTIVSNKAQGGERVYRIG